MLCFFCRHLYLLSTPRSLYTARHSIALINTSSDREATVFDRSLLLLRLWSHSLRSLSSSAAIVVLSPYNTAFDRAILFIQRSLLSSLLQRFRFDFDIDLLLLLFDVAFQVDLFRMVSVGGFEVGFEIEMLVVGCWILRQSF